MPVPWMLPTLAPRWKVWNSRGRSSAGMPMPLQIASYAVPARYFVTGLQTIFLAGDVWSVIWPNMSGMAVIAAVYIGLTARKTKTRLD